MIIFYLRWNRPVRINQRSYFDVRDFLDRNMERVEKFKTYEVILHHVKSMGVQKNKSFFFVVPVIDPK